MQEDGPELPAGIDDFVNTLPDAGERVDDFINGLPHAGERIDDFVNGLRDNGEGIDDFVNPRGGPPRSILQISLKPRMGTTDDTDSTDHQPGAAARPVIFGKNPLNLNSGMKTADYADDTDNEEVADPPGFTQWVSGPPSITF